MIYFVRSAEVDRSKVDEAFGWAVKVANWINGKFSEANVQVLRNVSGPLGAVHWLSTSDSLASFEQLMAALESDQEYQGMIAEAREQGLFAQGSLRDSIYRSVP